MRIIELTLQTNNLEKTKHFYHEIIGFDIIDDSEKEISFKVGSSKLKFVQVNSGYHPKYHFAFTIPTNKLEEAIAWTSHRVNLIKTDENEIISNFENWKAKAIYFYDNNLNILELICRTDLKNSVEDEFSIKAILNINEIGIATDHPLQLGTEINEKIKSGFFAKGPKGEDFAAVGTDHGLFVISNPDRNWYPTQDKVEKCKLKTKVKVNEVEFEMEFN